MAYLRTTKLSQKGVLFNLNVFSITNSVWEIKNAFIVSLIFAKGGAKADFSLIGWLKVNLLVQKSAELIRLSKSCFFGF